MRYRNVILGLVVLVALLVGIKATQIGKLIGMGKEMQKMGPPPEPVGTFVAQKQDWESTLSAIATISASKGVDVSNEAAGVVTKIHFESGARVEAGKVLVELDSKVERAQLAAIQSRIELARLNTQRSQALKASNSAPQAQVDTDESTLKSAEADAAALRAQIERKTVRAPFGGKLGIRLVNLGQYLNAGTPITSLESMDSVFVDFAVPQQRLPDLKPGTPVRVSIDTHPTQSDGPAEHMVREGKISALSPEIDSTTRTVKVRASVPNDDNKLRSGMFAKVDVILPKQDSVVAVPTPAVMHASYGDSVFIVENPKEGITTPDNKPIKVVRQQFVRLGRAMGDFVAIEEGLSPGQEVVFAGAFKLRNGARVVINNTGQAQPKLSPNPANSMGLNDTASDTQP